MRTKEPTSEVRSTSRTSFPGKQRVKDTQRFSTISGLSSILSSGVSHQIGKASHRGKLRSSNEDSIATVEFTYILKSISYPIGLYLVSDGMGGLEGGEIASGIAVTTIVNEISQMLLQSGWLGLKNGTSNEDLQRVIENAVYLANDEILQRGQHSNKALGATLTGALIIDRNAYIINVGDSRVYLFNENKGLQLITQDHSLVFRLYLMGHLKFEEIYNHPQKSQILRSLGEAGLKENLEEMAIQDKHPYFYPQELGKDDVLLLCSDGLWQMVRDPKIETILRRNPVPQIACDKLVMLANENGGEDNISVVVVKIA